MADPLLRAEVDALVDKYLRAPCKYASPYDHLERMPGWDVPAEVQEHWGAEQEAVEERWRGHERVVKQLMLGMQGIGYATARSRRGAV